MNLRFWRRHQQLDPLIDRLIRPPVYRFTGHDEGLEQRTRKIREQAERVRQTALHMDTRDDRRSTLHRVS